MPLLARTLFWASGRRRKTQVGGLGPGSDRDQHPTGPFAGRAPDRAGIREYGPNTGAVAFNAGNLPRPGLQAPNLDRDFIIPEGTSPQRHFVHVAPLGLPVSLAYLTRRECVQFHHQTLPADSFSHSANRPQWAYEIKHDGYRFIVRKVGDQVRVLSRAGKDWTAPFLPSLAP